MNLIAEKSDRAVIYEYARSYQQRPLVHLVITSERNQKRLEEIRKNPSCPDQSGDLLRN
jgi:hypothetical protein